MRNESLIRSNAHVRDSVARCCAAEPGTVSARLLARHTPEMSERRLWILPGPLRTTGA